jgi:hypothetical protein
MLGASGADDGQPHGARGLCLAQIVGQERNGRTADALGRREMQRGERSIRTPGQLGDGGSNERSLRSGDSAVSESGSST